MTRSFDINSSRRRLAMVSTFFAITALFSSAIIVSPVHADERRDGNHRGGDHRRDDRGDRGHGGWWGGGYYAPPPVVYGAPYYGYGAPPVVYGPAIGISMPGISIGVR